MRRRRALRSDCDSYVFPARVSARILSPHLQFSPSRSPRSYSFSDCSALPTTFRTLFPFV